MSKPKKKKNPKLNNGRDALFVAIKNGITKSGVHKDQKKEENKKRARKKVKPEE